jgi:hypothetical protein
MLSLHTYIHTAYTVQLWPPIFIGTNSAHNIGQHISLPTTLMQNAPAINNVNYVHLQWIDSKQWSSPTARAKHTFQFVHFIQLHILVKAQHTYSSQITIYFYSVCYHSCYAKAIPLQAPTGPEGSSRLRPQDFKTIGTWMWQDCQPYAPAAFTPRKYSWYSFLLEAESTPEP